MTLVTASLAIAGLCAVAIPILIHLLARQRRRPIEWAAMRFLLEAFRKHKRRLQLEQIILLAVRCLIVALLGLALARPILQSAGIIGTGGTRAVYLVIDDGLASGLTGDDQHTALDHHIAQAVEVVNALGPGDAVGVVTAARPAAGRLIPPSTDHAAVIGLLRSLAPRQSPSDLAGAFGFIRTATEQARKNTQQTAVYLFSDFRSGSAPLDSPLPATNADPTGQVVLLASPAADESISNVQVVGINPVRSVVLAGSSDGSGQITVRLRRSGGRMGNDVTRVRLAGDGLAAVEPRTIQWQPGQATAEAEFMVSFGAGTDRTAGITASIDDDALNADNAMHTVLEMRSQIRVLLVDRRSFGFEHTLDRLSAGQWIRRALEPLDKGPIQIVEAEPAALDLADTRTADVIIVPRPDLIGDAGWGILQRFTAADGLLVVMPPAEANVHPWTEHLSRELGLPWRIALEAVDYREGLPLAEEQPSSELLRLISSDLSELVKPVLAYRSLPVDLSQTQAQTLLVFNDGSPLLIAGTATAPAPDSTAAGHAAGSRGMVVYLACAPELSWTNLPSKPLMVPLFHEIIRQGLGLIRAGQHLVVGEQPALTLGPSAHVLVNQQGERFVLDSSGRAPAPFQRSGVYDVQDQSSQSVGKVAVNIETGAGASETQSQAAVSNWLKASGPWKRFDASHAASSLGASDSGAPISGILLITVLVLAIVETVLARLFSHAYVREGGIGASYGPQGGIASGAASAQRSAA